MYSKCGSFTVGRLLIRLDEIEKVVVVEGHFILFDLYGAVLFNVVHGLETIDFKKQDL